MILFFDKLFEGTLEKIAPKSKFGIIFSGGIDSSLQASYYFKKKKIVLACINHQNKDLITNNISRFKKFINKKLNIIQCNEKKYFYEINKTIKKFKHPLKKNVKVVFGASGADELFGGYSLYKYVNWASRKNINMSPYSKFKKNNKNSNLEKNYNKMWIRAFNKYSKFTNRIETKIQASLFVDYFGQTINKDNVSIDAIAGESSIEVRNIFNTREVIECALNLPIKYKLDLLAKDNMKCKPILKHLFIKYFNKNLVFKKQGFSGFPNESKKFLDKKDNQIVKKSLSKFKRTRELEWKSLNLFYFKKYLNIKYDLMKNL